MYVYSLQDVVMQDSKLYLIFEFLSMDLKRYMDTIPSGQYMESMLAKVSSRLLPWMFHWVSQIYNLNFKI